MFFSLEDYKKIEKWLLANSKKDTDFPEGNLPLSGEEVVVMVQDGVNRIIPVKTLLEQVELLEKLDFINITERYDIPPYPLAEAIASVPVDKRQLGQVVSFKNEVGKWDIFQFNGASLDQWQDTSLWRDLFQELPVIQHYLTLGDEENLTSEVVSETSELITYKMSLKDKKHVAKEFSGYGRVFLKKNILDADPGDPNGNGGNFLTQEMMSEKNTIYYIQYDYRIPTGTDLMVPEGSILYFTGGSIEGPGTLSFSDFNYIMGELVSGIITAHIGTAYSQEEEDEEIRALLNDELYASWFDWTAEDINALSFWDNTLIFDKSVTLKAPILIKGGIDCRGKYQLRFSLPGIQVVHHMLEFDGEKVGSPNLKRCVRLQGQNMRAVYGAIIHPQSTNIPIHYHIDMSGVRMLSNGVNLTGILVTPMTVTSEKDGEEISLTSGWGNIVLSGSIASLQSTRSTDKTITGVHIYVPEDAESGYSGTIVVKDFRIITTNGGSSTTANPDNIANILIDCGHYDSNVILDNITIDTAQGKGIVCKTGKVWMHNISHITDSNNKAYLTPAAIQVDADDVSIDGFDMVLKGMKDTNLTSAGIVVNGKNARVRNARMYMDSIGISQMLKLNRAKNFDIEASLSCDFTGGASGTNALLYLTGACSGNLDLAVDYQQILGMVDSLQEHVDLKLKGKTSVALISSSNNFGNIRIHDSDFDCDYLVLVAHASGIEIVGNKLAASVVVNSLNELDNCEICDNIVTLKQFTPPAADTTVPVRGATAENVVIKGNVFKQPTASPTYPKCIMEFPSLTKGIVTDNMFLGDVKAASFGVLVDSVIQDNIVSSEAEDPFVVSETGSSNSIVKDNVVLGGEGIFRNLNADDTDKKHVTIV